MQCVMIKSDGINESNIVKPPLLGHTKAWKAKIKLIKQIELWE